MFNEAARALLPSFRDPIMDMLVNAGGTVRLLEHARKKGIKLVHASSGSIYGNPIEVPIREDHPANPISPYGVSKLSSEHYCSMYHREFDVDVIALRYFNVYGPRQAVSEEMGVVPIFVRKALAGEPLRVFGDGKQTRDFLHVADVVSANLLAYRSEKGSGEAVNIGGPGKEVSILKLAEEVKNLCRFELEDSLRRGEAWGHPQTGGRQFEGAGVDWLRPLNVPEERSKGVHRVRKSSLRRSATLRRTYQFPTQAGLQSTSQKWPQA